jgi:hypothetical protein
MGGSLMKGFLDYELKKNSKSLKFIKSLPAVCSDDSFEKQLEKEMDNEQF